jgi:hypothetical protein
VRGGRHASAGHRLVGRVEVLYSRKGGSREQRGLDEHILQLQQGAEIRPCIELEKVGNHRYRDLWC